MCQQSPSSVRKATPNFGLSQHQMAACLRRPSLLQTHALQGLEDVCPGAKKLNDFRKVCVGFFLAE